MPAGAETARLHAGQRRDAGSSLSIQGWRRGKRDYLDSVRIPTQEQPRSIGFVRTGRHEAVVGPLDKQILSADGDWWKWTVATVEPDGKTGKPAAGKTYRKALAQLEADQNTDNDDTQVKVGKDGEGAPMTVEDIGYRVRRGARQGYAYEYELVRTDGDQEEVVGRTVISRDYTYPWQVLVDQLQMTADGGIEFKPKPVIQPVVRTETPRTEEVEDAPRSVEPVVIKGTKVWNLGGGVLVTTTDVAPDEDVHHRVYVMGSDGPIRHADGSYAIRVYDDGSPRSSLDVVNYSDLRG